MTQKWLVVSVCPLFLLAAACGPSVTSGGDGGGSDVDNCAEGWGDCDGDDSNGCETDLNSLDHCGSCTIVCGDTNASPTCQNGQCQMNCTNGFFDCDSTPATGCEATLGSQNHCSGCNDSCYATNATGQCVSNACVFTCASGYGDCNDNMDGDGCESDFTQKETCGACDSGCAGECVAGECASCDSALTLDSTDPMDAAKAIGLCADVTSAQWVLPDGSAVSGQANFDLGHGILTGFGPNVAVREGSKFLALSSGTARQPTDPGYASPAGYDKGYSTNHPAGFPKESPACPSVTTGTPYDGIGLEVTLAVPEWAEGFSFDFDFYTFEYPNFICSTFNDFFVAILDPVPVGQTDGNISFDSLDNPVSVNNGFLEACGCLLGPPCTAGGKTFTCALGTDPLTGTGFEGDALSSHAATGWLATQAPAAPGTSITIRFAIYDSGDGDLDSTTIIDRFRWLPSAPDVGTNPID